MSFSVWDFVDGFSRAIFSSEIFRKIFLIFFLEGWFYVPGTMYTFIHISFFFYFSSGLLGGPHHNYK